MTLWLLLLTVVALAAVAYLLDRAPFIPVDWKPILRWVLLVVVVIVVLDFIGALQYLKGVTMRR